MMITFALTRLEQALLGASGRYSSTDSSDSSQWGWCSRARNSVSKTFAYRESSRIEFHSLPSTVSKNLAGGSRMR